MADFGNIAGVVKSFVEPQNTDTTPKRFVIWAKEVTAGSAAVNLLVYDFVLADWVPIRPSSNVLKARLASTTSNIADLATVVSIDGKNLADGDFILLTAQSDLKQNGVYKFSSTSGLQRDDVFIARIPGNHIVYVTDGDDEIGTLYYSTNISNASSLVVDIDNLGYAKAKGESSGTVTSVDLKRNWFSISTSDTTIPLATAANWLNRFIAIFNGLAAFSIPDSQDLLIKHVVETAPLGGSVNVQRNILLKFNPKPGATSYGTGGTTVVPTDFLIIKGSFEPEGAGNVDEISLRGTGPYNFGASDRGISNSNNSNQFDFNTKTAEAFTEIYSPINIVEVDLGPSAAAVEDIINQRPTFNIPVKQRWIFSVTGTGVNPITKKYEIKLGKGTYGTGGTTLSTNDMFLLNNSAQINTSSNVIKYGNFLIHHADTSDPTSLSPQVGDLCQGWISPDRWIRGIYTGGDVTLDTSWDIIDEWIIEGIGSQSIGSGTIG